MSKTLEVKTQLVECITLTKMFNGQEWMKAIIEPNDASFKYGSTGGGQITIILPHHVGTTYYSHGDNTTLKQFLAETYPESLIHRLFGGISSKEPVETGEEFIEWVYQNCLSLIFEARRSKEVSKKELRSVYTELLEVCFENPELAYKDLSKETNEILDRIFGEDFWWSSNRPEKENETYKYQLQMIKEFQQYLKGQINEK
ncbi:hypothetical protein ACRS5A_18680 [Acinetobacter baumannii]|uniref:hypothetical protein n=1 Tax=Acinetobacter baumannii TaxID=470 RepID=UPI003B3229D9